MHKHTRDLSKLDTSHTALGVIQFERLTNIKMSTIQLLRLACIVGVISAKDNHDNARKTLSPLQHTRFFSFSEDTTTGKPWTGFTRTSTSYEPPTEVTIKHQLYSECHDFATDFAYRKDLCSGARDPESYLDLGISRYTCLNRCGQSPEYGNRFFQCGCDASCEAFKDCCRDMAQLCPDLYNTGQAEYPKGPLQSRFCDDFVIVYKENEDTTSTSLTTKAYPSFYPTIVNTERDLPFDPRTLREFSGQIRTNHVVDTNSKIIFQNYAVYGELKLTNSIPHFIPRVLSLFCHGEASGIHARHGFLQVLPWCRVTKVGFAMTHYRRPCKVHQILKCRCKNGQKLKEHLHNACLGKDYSNQSLYRYPLWDKQVVNAKDVPPKAGECDIQDISYIGSLGGETNSFRKKDVSMRMRILPVLSRVGMPLQTSKGGNATREVREDANGGIERESDIGYIVELDNMPERSFYCSSLHNYLEDCWLEACAEGGLIWTGHLSDNAPARRSCIVPVRARVVPRDLSSGVPFCTCLLVLKVLDDLGIWEVRIEGTPMDCSLKLVPLPKSKYNTRFFFDFQCTCIFNLNNYVWY